MGISELASSPVGLNVKIISKTVVTTLRMCDTPASVGPKQRRLSGLCRVADLLVAIISELPTTHEVFVEPPLPGTAPPSAPAFPRDQGLSPAPPIRAASRQQAASALPQRDLRRFATRVASLHMPPPAVSRRTRHLLHSPPSPSPAESSLLPRGRP